MPSFTMVPPRGDHPVHGHFWIPIDDENCWAWTLRLPPDAAADRDRGAGDEDGNGVHSEYMPGTYRPLANKDNDYLIDREAQKARRHLLAASRASPCRMPRCRRAWGRSWTAPRRSGVDRQRHHHGAAEAEEGRRSVARRGRNPTGCGPRAPSRAVGGGSAAARTHRSSRPVAKTCRCARACGSRRYEHGYELAAFDAQHDNVHGTRPNSGTGSIADQIIVRDGDDVVRLTFDTRPAKVDNIGRLPMAWVDPAAADTRTVLASGPAGIGANTNGRWMNGGC